MRHLRALAQLAGPVFVVLVALLFPSVALAYTTSISAISTTANPTQVDTFVNLTGSVTPEAGGPGMTGTYYLYDEGVLIDQQNTASANFFFNGESFSAGTHHLTVTYANDPSYDTCTTAVLAQVVEKDASTATLTSESNPTPYDAHFGSVPFFFVLYTGQPVATGSVVASDNGVPKVTVQLDKNGQAPNLYLSFEAGDHVIVATYSGDAYHAPASATVTETCTKATTDVSFTSSLNPSLYGQTTTLTASVSSGLNTETGAITFYDGSTPLGAAVPLVNRVATLDVSTLTVGTHTLSAAYGGDSNFLPATSGTISDEVDVLDTTTTVTPSSNPVAIGGSVTMTVHVTTATGTPTGTVTPTIDGVDLAAVTLVNGVATFPFSASSGGDHTVSATYPGGGTWKASKSSTLDEKVTMSGATLALKCNPPPGPSGVTTVDVGTSVTFLATVTATTGPTPQGTVNFYLNGNSTLIGSANLDALGVATFSTSSLPAGYDPVYAFYPGSMNDGFAGGTTYVAVLLPTSTSLVSSQNPVNLGTLFTLTATTSVQGSAALPDGQVQFLSDGDILGSGVATAGVATLDTELPAGTHQLAAVYQASLLYDTSTSPVVDEVVIDPNGGTGGTSGAGGGQGAGGATGSGGIGGSTSAGAGGASSAGGAGNTGGSTSAGGSGNPGGNNNAGGSGNLGGSSSVGGASSLGGSSATGGTVSSGGSSNLGGTNSGGGQAQGTGGAAGPGQGGAAQGGSPQGLGGSAAAGAAGHNPVAGAGGTGSGMAGMTGAGPQGTGGSGAPMGTGGATGLGGSSHAGSGGATQSTAGGGGKVGAAGSGGQHGTGGASTAATGGAGGESAMTAAGDTNSGDSGGCAISGTSPGGSSGTLALLTLGVLAIGRKNRASRTEKRSRLALRVSS